MELLTHLGPQLQAILPEIILAATICLLVLADMAAPLRASRAVCHGLAMAGTLAALVVAAAQLAGWGDAAQRAWGATLATDGLARFFRLLLLSGTAIALGMAGRSRELAGYRQGEFAALMLGATLGACLLAGAEHFVLFIVALETVSLCSYVLAGADKHRRRSAEAALKYMLFGAVASGVMLFGISYLYGMSGTLEVGATLPAIAARASGASLAGAGGLPLAALLALMLVLAGLLFKVAAVPFHFWCPDVYEGAPTPVTAWLSVVGKTAGFAALLRLLLPMFGEVVGAAAPTALAVLLGAVAAVTMTLGNLVALRQTNIKRLLAYSSIAHAGYMLMALSVPGAESLRSVLFYLFIYLFMNLGAFWVAIVLIDRLGAEDIGQWRGVRQRSPLLFWVMFLFLISLTGLPPTAGFVAKLMLFKVVIGAGLGGIVDGALTPAAWGYLGLALLGALNSAISLYYYMKIARAMGLDASPEPTADEAEGAPLPLPLAGLDRAWAVALAFPVIALLWFTPLLWLIDRV